METAGITLGLIGLAAIWWLVDEANKYHKENNKGRK